MTVSESGLKLANSALDPIPDGYRISKMVVNICIDYTSANINVKGSGLP
jgi:hypothetical protein